MITTIIVVHIIVILTISITATFIFIQYFYHSISAAVLAKNNVKKGDDLTVMVVNEGEIDLYLNFACSCRLHNLTMSNVIVFAGSRYIILFFTLFKIIYNEIEMMAYFVIFTFLVFLPSLTNSLSLALSLSHYHFSLTPSFPLETPHSCPPFLMSVCPCTVK